MIQFSLPPEIFEEGFSTLHAQARWSSFSEWGGVQHKIYRNSPDFYCKFFSQLAPAIFPDSISVAIYILSVLGHQSRPHEEVLINSSEGSSP